MGKYNSRPGLKQIDVGARKVAPTYGREAYVTFVEKAAGALVFESDAERLASYMLCIDPRVRRFQAQPFGVDLVEGRLLRTPQQRDEAKRKYAGRKGASLYTPDFYVERLDGAQIVVEVKLDGFIGGDADQVRLEQATKVLAKYGHVVSRVVLPSNIKHPLRSNLRLLHHAALRPDLWPDEQVVDCVSQLAGKGARTMFDFAKGLGLSVDLFPALVIHGALSADVVGHRLEGKMPMEPAYGSLDHLGLMERLVQ